VCRLSTFTLLGLMRSLWLTIVRYIGAIIAVFQPERCCGSARVVEHGTEFNVFPMQGERQLHDLRSAGLKAHVNGASGFVGSHLCRSLARTGWDVASQSRTDVGLQLQSGAVLFHLVARAHCSQHARNSSEYMRVNCDLALNMYRQAAKADAAGFVFVSTAKVLGESSPVPLLVDAQPCPRGAYAESKHQAELALREAHADLGLPVTVIRPPLVYGPGVKANFRRLLDWTRRFPVLPLGAATAPRSMVSVDNLVDFMGHAAKRVNGYQVWTVKDDVSLSVCDLVKRVARLMNKSILLPNVPRWWFEQAAFLPGVSGMTESLFDPFLIDDSGARQTLAWQAPQSVKDALHKTVCWYLDRERVSC
jgi:nucleoside-diphosphate-sugar epimerase